MVEKQPLRPEETKEPIACRMKTQEMSITLILENHQLTKEPYNLYFHVAYSSGIIL